MTPAQLTTAGGQDTTYEGGHAMAEGSPPTPGSPDWLPERLARIRALAEENERRRAAQTECQHPHDGVELERRFASGSRHVYRGCADCCRPLEGGRLLPKVGEQKLPKGLDERFTRPPCVRCGDFGTELHHFAPRAIFGKDECELWPTAWLCTGCHDYWHRMMKGAG